MQTLPGARTFRVLAIVAALLPLSGSAFATPLTITSSAVASFALNPSSDYISLNAGSATVDPSSGASVVFQTGDFRLGNSAIADQVIPFSFQDTITLNGVTRTLTIFGQNNVTSTADTLTIFAGTPTVFGNAMFTLQAFTISGYNIGEDDPIALKVVVTPTPEPGTLALAGTGLLGGAALARRARDAGKGRELAPATLPLVESAA